MKSNERYESARHTFSPYFLAFGDKNGARLELMQRPDVYINPSKEHGMIEGFAHIAIAVGSKENVDLLTAKLNTDGYAVVGQPRATGDGYYESIIEDNEGKG